jgi:hypothetical protein
MMSDPSHAPNANTPLPLPARSGGQLGTDPHPTDRSVVIFLHNMKTGSETLRGLIHRHYMSSQICTARGKVAKAAGLADLVGSPDARGCRVIQGHIPFGVHELVAAPCQYVTFLRRPESRILSLYYYSIQRPNVGFYDLAGPHRESLASFVRDARILEVDNGQTRRISGMSPKFGRCTAEMLERAKHNLASHFPVVGLTERYDESVVLLQRFLGWPSAFYQRANVNRKRPAGESVSASDLEVIERFNELDRELYAYAVDLFERRIEQQGPEFRAEVEAFTALNRDVQPIWVHVRQLERELATFRKGRDQAEWQAGARQELAALREELERTQRRLRAAQTRVRELESSRWWRLANRYRRLRAALGL